MMKVFVEDMTLEQLDAAARGEIKVYDGKAQVRLRLNKTDLESFEQAKKQGYLVLSGTKFRHVINVYYYLCRFNNHPAIIVHQKRRYSAIRLEFTFVGDYWPSQNVLDQIRDIAMQYAQPGDLVWLYQYIDRVPNEDAENIASTLLAMFLQDQGLQNKYDKPVEEELSNNQLKRKAQTLPRRPQKRKVETYEYDRNPYVTELAKRRANGVCQLCGSFAPFKTKDGKPFLEVHHIEWLSRNGEDIIENTVALCPNCHRKMHILDLAEDRDYLKQQALVDID